MVTNGLLRLLKCRPRKGAWIEIVAGQGIPADAMSPPQGGVD